VFLGSWGLFCWRHRNAATQRMVMLPGASFRCTVNLPLDAIEFYHSQDVIFVVTNG